MASTGLEEAKRKARDAMAQRRQDEGDGLSIEFVGMTLTDTQVVPIAKKTGIILDKECLRHNCKFGSIHGETESPARLEAIISKLSETGINERCVNVSLRRATDEEIKAVHSDEYLTTLKSIKELPDQKLKALAESYDSIYICNETFEIVSNVTGGVIDMMEKIKTCQLQNGFAVVRPPSHHAGHNEANGYSFLNHIAIAAKIAVEKWNLKRVLIVDWDVHHGQGIQRAFYNDPRVLYFSIHRYESGKFWPHLQESNWDHIGEGKGKGYNVNVPWNMTKMGDAEYFSVFQHVLLPMILEFQPELILVAAGFDISANDPKGMMSVSTTFFSHMTHTLMGFANGKLALFLEGGYNKTELADGIYNCLSTLLGDSCTPFTPLKAPCQSAQDTIFNVIEQLQPYWTCFHTELSNFYKPTLESQADGDSKESLKKEMKETSERETNEMGDASKIQQAPNRTCLVYDDRMKRHCVGLDLFHELVQASVSELRTWMEANMTHPERPERISKIYEKHQEYGLVDRCLRVEARHATVEELRLCHSENHIKDMADTRKLSALELQKKQVDYNSIYFCADTYDCALMATGSLLNVIDTVLTGKSRSGVAIVRPPGHHAGENNAAGFCFFNNAPIATKYAQKKYNTQRILIVDWDVHHGNGTQSILEEDPGVLYISLHGFDDGAFYPGMSGHPRNVGKGAGEGYNVNIAWNHGPMGDAEYLAAFRHIVMPIAYEYNPDFVLISAGFDAARGDPLGCYDVTPDGYGLMTHMLNSLAGGRVVMLLEGGYNLISIAESMARCTHSLLGDPCLSFSPGHPKPTAYDCILTTLNYHSRYWKSAAYQLKLLRHQLEKMDIINQERLAVESAKVTESKPAPTDEGDSTKDEQEIPARETGGGDQKGTKGEEGGAVSSGTTQGAQGDSAGGSQNEEAERGLDEPMAAGGSDQSTDFQIGAMFPDGDSEGTLFAVTPLSSCPHLESSVQPLPPKGLDARAECQVCSEGKENWVCLTCYQVLCGRYINQHMIQHGQESEHRMVLSYADLSVWCYGCEQYVHNEIVLPAKQAAHQSKFGTNMPS